MRKGLLLISFLFWSVQIFAQVDTLALYKKLNDRNINEHERLQVLNLLTEMHKFTPDSMMKYSSLGIANATRLKRSVLLANFYHLRAVAKLNKSQFAGAIIDINRAVNIDRGLKDYKGIGRTLKIRAIIHYYQSEYELAISDFSDAVENFDKSGYRIDLPTCYIYMAELSRRNDDEDLGNQYDQKAYQVSLELDKTVPTGDPNREIVDLNYIQSVGNLADHFGKKGDKKAELKYLNIALLKSNNKKYYPTYLVYLANAAECEYKSGNKKKGVFMANQARKLAELNQLKRAEANAYVKLMMMAPNKSELRRLYKKGLTIAESINNDQLISNFYITLADVLEQFGDYRGSLTSFKRYVDFNDSVQVKTNRDRVAKLESTFRLKESSFKLRESEQNNIVKEYKIRKYINLSLILAFSSIIFLLLSFKIWRLNKKVGIQNERLKNLNDFKNVMLNIIGHDVSGMLAAMGSLLHIMNNKSINGRADDDMANLVVLRQEAFELLNSLMIWGDTDVQSTNKISQIDVKSALDPDVKTIIRMAKFYGIKVDLELEPLTVLFNEQHLRFIFRNMALNSLKYSERGQTVSISISAVDGIAIVSTKNLANIKNLSRLSAVFQNPLDPKIEQKTGAALALKLCLMLAKSNNTFINFSNHNFLAHISMNVPLTANHS